MSKHAMGPGEPDQPAPDADLAYERPAGVPGGFAQHEPFRPAPPSSMPATHEEQQHYGRPAPDVPFAPLPGERIPPAPMQHPQIPAAVAAAFGAPPEAVDGFAAPPGTRLTAAATTESPWWKPGAVHDPWRDPNSPFWLGRGAVFPVGQPEQVPAEEDAEADDFPPEPPDEQPPSNVITTAKFGRRTITMLVALGLVVGALGGGIGYFLASRSNDALHTNGVSLSKTGKPANRPPGSVADIAKRVGPAVVSVEVAGANELTIGSGVVIDGHGYVLTNNHVIVDAVSGKGSILVRFSDEATAKARLVGRDPASDLAVLKVPTSQLTVAALGDSSTLAVGDPVIAIGSPLALQGTVTTGIVSSLDRPVSITDDSTGSTTFLDAIQTDAAINHGNSGGPLVDASGAVVGINSAAAFGNGQGDTVSGIGFAIPINYARTIAEQLIKSGKASHASLGATGKDVLTQDGLQQGVYLEQVTANGAAGKAGLKAEDVVVTAAGVATPTYADLAVLVQRHKPGDKIAVTFYRGSAKKTVTVTLGSD